MLVDHIAIAVSDLEASAKVYADLLALQPTGFEEIEEFAAKICFFAPGAVKVELIAPLNEQSSLVKFLEKRGPGMHHVAFSVANLDKALERLIKQGFEKSTEPRIGYGGYRVCFLHPKSVHGTLVEIVEKLDTN